MHAIVVVDPSDQRLDQPPVRREALFELTREYPENPLFKKELSQLSVKLQSGKPQ